MKTLPAFKLRSNKQTKKKNQPTLTTQEKKETLSKKREAASATIQSQIQSYAETLRQHIDQPNVYTDEVLVKHDPNTPPKKPRKVTKADLRRQERLMRGQMKELEPYLYPYLTEWVLEGGEDQILPNQQDQSSDRRSIDISEGSNSFFIHNQEEDQVFDDLMIPRNSIKPILTLATSFFFTNVYHSPTDCMVGIEHTKAFDSTEYSESNRLSLSTCVPIRLW